MMEERFQKCLTIWKIQCLSKGERLTLIKSILSSSLIYFLSLFVIPQKMNLKLEKIQKDFFLRRGVEGEVQRKVHLVN